MGDAMISQLTPLLAREIHDSRLAAAAAHRASPRNTARRHLRSRLARLHRRILSPARPTRDGARA
jgi:hypothetical protein